MPNSTLVTKGKVLLPEEVREHLHLRDGDQVEFLIEPGGKVEMRPVPEGRPATVEEMDGAIGRHLAENDERIQKGGKGWA